MAINFRSIVTDPKLEIVGDEVPLAAFEKASNILNQRYAQSAEAATRAQEALNQQLQVSDALEKPELKAYYDDTYNLLKNIATSDDYLDQEWKTKSLGLRTAANLKVAEDRAKEDALIKSNGEYLDSAIEEVCLSEECRFNRQTYSKIEGNIKSITDIRKSVKVEHGYKTCIVTLSANVERSKNTIEFVVDGKYDLKHGEIVEFVGSSNQEGNLFVFNYYDGKYVRIIQHRIATKWQKYMLPSKPSVLKAQVPEGQMQSKELLLFLFVTSDVSMKSSYTDNELKSVIAQIPANTRRVITRHINIMKGSI
jgi:hypothetical protein